MRKVVRGGLGVLVLGIVVSVLVGSFVWRLAQSAAETAPAKPAAPAKEIAAPAGNPICHFEFLVPDPEKTKAFYGKIFAWKFQSTPGGEYQMIQTGSWPFGGLMKKPEGMPVNAALRVYVQVESIDETLKKAEAAGAKVEVPKMAEPGEGYFALFQDPDGIVLGIFEVSRGSLGTTSGGAEKPKAGAGAAAPR